VSKTAVIFLGLVSAVLVIAFAVQLPEGPDRMSRMRDTSLAGIRARKAESRRVWEALGRRRTRTHWS
jgi:hypothetical protein